MAGGFDVAVAEETLNGDDVGARLQETRGVGMSEFVEGGLFLLTNGKELPKAEERTATPIADAITLFSDHVRTHSPDKPKTLQRYQKVLEHFERHLGKRKFIEAITRADIDDFKIKRTGEKSQQHDRKITPRTINFEVSVLRTFFYFLVNERGLNMDPCARFKPLKDQSAKARKRPPTYTPDELGRIFNACNEGEKTIFATLLLTGLREQELYFLTWQDLNLNAGTIKVTPKPKEGFSPKDYEEPLIPIPPDLVKRLKNLLRPAGWIFPNAQGRRTSHLLRRLKHIATKAKVENATLHKFRHYLPFLTMSRPATRASFLREYARGRIDIVLTPLSSPCRGKGVHHEVHYQ